MTVYCRPTWNISFGPPVLASLHLAYPVWTIGHYFNPDRPAHPKAANMSYQLEGNPAWQIRTGEQASAWQDIGMDGPGQLIPKRGKG